MRKMLSSGTGKQGVHRQIWRAAFVLTLLLTLLTACSARQEEEALPTLAPVAGVPSLTPSATSLPTLTPSSTWTPRPTNTPYVTPTFVNTAVPPEIQTRQAAEGGLISNIISGGSGATGAFPTVTPVVPRSTQTAVAATATAVISATQIAATATQIAATTTSIAISATPFPNNWRASFYNNRDLSGEPVLVRSDANIAFNWFGGSPGPGVNSDNFSARWERNVSLGGATYLFYAASDDGIRVFLNDNLIINAWGPTQNRVVYARVAVPAGEHRLRVEYFEAEGDAYVYFDWQLATENSWVGEYYNNPALLGPPVFVRQDTNLNFNWGTSGPNGLPSDNFSIRWTRNINFSPGTKEFLLNVDDGAKVYINSTLFIDRWGPYDGSQTFRRDTQLSGPQWIRVEYREITGNALIDFRIRAVTPTPTPTRETRVPLP
jgi:hypothetical protein